MSARVVRLPLLLLLIAALAAAHVRPGDAEGDPLPPDPLDPDWTSFISSLHDLGVAGELREGEEPRHSHAHPGRSTRSLIEPERALIAECKVRTEVQEVTRDMHDRRNANFLLWPLCVEVQRCSGCCNSHSMQCVPVLTRTRDLMVRKIQYVNFKLEVGDVVVSVEDHVSCRCQNRAPPRPPPPVPPPVPQPPPVQPVTPPKTPTSKAELHRHDDQKHNQRPAQTGGELWPLGGGYTQLARWTPHPPPPPAYTLGAAPEVAVTAGARPQGPQGQPDTGAPQGSGSEGGPFLPQHPRHPNHPHHPHHPHPHHPPQVSPGPGMRYTLISFQADSASTQPANHKPEQNPSPSPSTAATYQKEPSLELARVDLDGWSETASPANHIKAPEQEESGSTNSGERPGLPASPVQDQGSGPAHSHPHPAEPQHRPTASHTGVSLQRAPGRTPAPGGRTPRRPTTARRRRKHRNRISKNAIRAIIM